MIKHSAPPAAVPYRTGEAQHLTCPHDRSSLSLVNRTSDAEERTRAKTYACHTHGHVWIESIAPDGSREWGESDARQGRLS